MRTTFSISLADLRQMRPAFGLHVRESATIRTISIPCAMIVVAGLICLWGRSELAIVGGFLTTLGASIGLLAYFYARQSVKDKRAQYEGGILTAFENLHCRDERVFEVDADGFRLSCKCGEVSRSWSELQRFSEYKSAFVIGTKAETEIIPKTAFASEGAMTEFRTIFRERIEQGRTMVAQLIDFKYDRSDYQRAVLLHILSGGGWRLLAKALFGIGLFTFALGVVLSYSFVHGGALAFIGGGLGALVHSLLKTNGKPKRLGTQRIFVDATGMQLEDNGTTARIPWNQFSGYLEDSKVLLLYHHSGAYRLIPKRVLARRDFEIRTLIAEHLPRYRYRSLGNASF